MSGLLLPLEIHITPGEHPEAHLFGLTFNIDTIISTLVAGSIVILLGFLVRRVVTRDTRTTCRRSCRSSGSRSSARSTRQVEDNLGKVHPFVAPLAISLFFFILIANWLELVPSQLNEEAHLLPAPTADVNLTYALALFAVGSVWVYGIRTQGLGYFKHFVQPVPDPAPAQCPRGARQADHSRAPAVRQHLRRRHHARPDRGDPVVGRACRSRTLLWKMFDMVIGGLQAFIFALLTVLYFAMASGGHGGLEEHDHTEKKTEELAA